MRNVSASLPQQINEAHRLAQEHAHTALDHAFRAGELLAQAKEQAGHGGWLEWLRANCEMSERQARNYIRLASNRQRVADFRSQRAALAELVAPSSAGSNARFEPIDADEILATGLRAIPSELCIAVESGCVTAGLIDGKLAIMLAESQRSRGYWYVCDFLDKTYNSRPILGAAVGLLVGQIAGWDRAEWHMADQHGWFPEAA